MVDVDNTKLDLDLDLVFSNFKSKVDRDVVNFNEGENPVQTYYKSLAKKLKEDYRFRTAFSLWLACNTEALKYYSTLEDELELSKAIKEVTVSVKLMRKDKDETVRMISDKLYNNIRKIVYTDEEENNGNTDEVERLNKILKSKVRTEVIKLNMSEQEKENLNRIVLTLKGKDGTVYRSIKAPSRFKKRKDRGES